MSKNKKKPKKIPHRHKPARAWTPFVDVTESLSSPLIRKLGVSAQAALLAVVGTVDGKLYENSLYRVIKAPLPVTREDGTEAVAWKLSIRSQENDAAHDWRHFQRIKNELCGPEYEALEIYPAESRLVDTANQFYLWVLPEGERIAFGFRDRLVMEDPGTSGAKQRPFSPDVRPTDLTLPNDRDDAAVLLSAQKRVDAMRKEENEPHEIVGGPG